MTRSASSTRKSTVFSKVTGWIAVGAIALVVLALIVVAIGPSAFNWLRTPNPPSTASIPPETDFNRGLNSDECAWKQENANYDNNRWFAEGIDAIRLATNPAEARDAAQVWVEEVRKDPNLLAGAAQIILNQDVDKTTLFEEDGCATDTAIQLAFEIETTFALSTFRATNAPSDGYNSGVEDETVVGSLDPGVSGDRKAIQITLPDGRVIWIMARCGNIVTPAPPQLPPGCTDEGCPPCPPGNTTPSCAPKSSEPEDYVFPEGKPPVTANPVPEATPPPVVTTQPGGGGVIDTPTNNPGSETGGTAPGATPAPTTPATPPPNQGGTNGPGDPGGF